MSSDNSIDLILGDYRTAILSLTWPMMVSMFLTMAYTIIDCVWISGLGVDALSAVGFFNRVFSIIVGFGAGLGAGANSVIARYIGAGDRFSANNAGVHSIFITLIISFLLSVFFILFLPFLLDFMHAGCVKPLVLSYGNVILCFVFLFTLSNLGVAILRSEGFVKRAMYIIGITSVLNIFLDPVFIYGFGWGIVGAAWATVFSAFITVLVFSYWLKFGDGGYLDLSLSNFSFSWSIVFDELIVGIPSSVEAFVYSLTSFIVNIFIVDVAGTVGVGVCNICLRMIEFASIFLNALGTSVLTLTGVAFGEGNVSKINDVFSYSLFLGSIISVILMVIVFVFAPQLSYIFAYSPGTSFLIPKISMFLRILFFVIITVNFGVVPASMFQGVGKGLTSLGLSIFRTLIAESIGAYVFAIVLGFGEIGIYYGLVAGATCGAILSYVCGKLYIQKLFKESNSS